MLTPWHMGKGRRCAITCRSTTLQRSEGSDCPAVHKQRPHVRIIMQCFLHAPELMLQSGSCAPLELRSVPDIGDAACMWRCGMAASSPQSSHDALIWLSPSEGLSKSTLAPCSGRAVLKYQSRTYLPALPAPMLRICMMFVHEVRPLDDSILFLGGMLETLAVANNMQSNQYNCSPSPHQFTDIQPLQSHHLTSRGWSTRSRLEILLSAREPVRPSHSHGGHQLDSRPGAVHGVEGGRASAAPPLRGVSCILSFDYACATACAHAMTRLVHFLRAVGCRKGSLLLQG